VVVRLFEIKLESLVLVVPAIDKHSDRDNSELESWLYRLLSSSGLGWSGAVPALESRNSKILAPERWWWWSRRKSSTIYRGYWTFGKVGVGERAGIVIEKLIGRKMERSSKLFLLLF